MLGSEKGATLANILDTGIKVVRNVDRLMFGSGSIKALPDVVKRFTSPNSDGTVVYLVDHFFREQSISSIWSGIPDRSLTYFVDSSNEPTTDGIDLLTRQILEDSGSVALVVAVGGGSTLDTGKAVSNLLTNGGRASQYQGWDLVRLPGVPKVGVPTISGTGSEATRTCVMTNPASGLKLGMNSDYSVFDFLILDPDLTGTVPRDQYFYTGMDAYIHCVESLAGSYRNAVGDAFSKQTIALCDEVFSSDDMMSSENREKLMVASYLGGSAIATTYVGVVHPFSAGLSVVLGLHHCIANCIALNSLSDYYPEASRKLRRWAEKQSVAVPSGICRDLEPDLYSALEKATLIHEKPLTNALGPDFKTHLTSSRVEEIFRMM